MAAVNRKVTYRLYPTAKQNEAMLDMLGLHQRLYNTALEQRIMVYRSHGISLNFASQCKELTELRAAFPQYQTLNAQSSQVTLKRVDLSFQHFFGRVREGKEKPGFPRFKSFHRFSGWGYKTAGDGWRLITNEKMQHGRLRLSGIGHIQIRGQARTPGIAKTCEIMHKGERWYASITIECEPKRQAGKLAGGMDWGVETFATLELSDNTKKDIENPRHTKQSLQQLQAAQRELARKERGSRNREKACKRVAKLHAKIANRRSNFLHQQTSILITLLCLIATEKLNVKPMTSNGGSHKRGLNREILSTAPATFIQTLKYKAEEASTEWVDIPTRKVKPSQTCSNCGAQERKPLSERQHKCKVCGFETGRDLNAAKVMLNWALTGSVTGKELAAECGAGSSGLNLAAKTKLPALKHETPSIPLCG